MNEIVSQFDTLTLNDKSLAGLGYWMMSCLDAESRVNDLEARLYASESRAELDAARAEIDRLALAVGEACTFRRAWQCTSERWEKEACKARTELDAMRAENERLRKQADTCEQRLEAAKGDIDSLLKDFNDMERRCGEWQEKARNCVTIGQVADNGDGTETRILPVRMKCGMVPDGYEVIGAVSRGLTAMPPLLADCGDVLDGELPSCEWEPGEFRLQLKPKAAS